MLRDFLDTRKNRCCIDKYYELGVFLVGVVFRRRCDSSSAAPNDNVPSSVGIRTVLPNKRRIDERLLEHIFFIGTELTIGFRRVLIASSFIFALWGPFPKSRGC